MLTDKLQEICGVYKRRQEEEFLLLLSVVVQFQLSVLFSLQSTRWRCAALNLLLNLCKKALTVDTILQLQL